MSTGERDSLTSDNSLRDFIESTTIPLHWVGPDGTILWANPAEIELLGYDRDEYVGHNIADFHVDASVIADILARLTRGETLKNQEARMRCKDGSIRHVLIDSSGLFADGKFVHTRCVTRDVTSQKLAEKSSGLLTAIVDSSDDAIISKRLDGVITSWNRSAERLFGYTPEEVIGQPITLIIPADRLAEETMILERLRKGDRIDHFETVRVRKDGTHVNISVTISPVHGSDGSIVGASKVARDITDRKRIEADRHRFVTLADRCPEFIGMSDIEGRPFYANEAGLKLVGLQSLEELRKVMVVDFFFPEDREYILNDFIPKVLREGKHETEIRFKHFQTGSAIWMIFNVFVIRDLGGTPIGLATFSQNITGRKRTEEELKESEERLRALAEQLESQVLVRTQELDQRNSDVLQQSDQLRELSRRLWQSQDEERRRIARDLHDSAGQIVSALGMQLSSIVQYAVKPEVRQAAQEGQEMVQQLSKEIRTVSYLLHPPLLDELGLSQTIRWYMQGLTERSGLEIELEIPEDFRRLPDDLELAIFRIVQESLTNIHRHSGSKSATIRILQNAETVFVEVQDSGAGISREKLAAIRTQRAGVGITGMRERIRHLNGVMKIDSDSSGTKISAAFPIPSDRAPDKT